MQLEPKNFQQLLSAFKLERLFNELGWDRVTTYSIVAEFGKVSFTLRAIAHKRGVTIFQCTSSDGEIPARAVILKIEGEARKAAHEHLLIFTDREETMQRWVWVDRIPGRPSATRIHTWHKGTSGESLRQKLEAVVWALEEEEGITLTDVIAGLKHAFDRDRISKAFYERFQEEHKAFAEFIEGISSDETCSWYSSLMLNRLMFVYFIQRKGFLDGNRNYLVDRMQKVKQTAGENKFHSFYRVFLKRLFHEGLGQKQISRSNELQNLVGSVPYLNGGLFDLHQVEESNPSIDIPDCAFERLFQFFDSYDWHLDDRPLASGSEINPDVLGYIFEKYINQKQMGAYYTKEDITEYIAKYTIIPFLLERARTACKAAFEGEGNTVWDLLSSRPQRYIYPAVKRGVVDATGEIISLERLLPHAKEALAQKIDEPLDASTRASLGISENASFIHGETWREYSDRRESCLALIARCTRGELTEIDDLVTENIDIWQFARDVISDYASEALLRVIWRAMAGASAPSAAAREHGIAVLDPTCGSGAFLFAALNVLEPLYEACIDRMEEFVENDEGNQTTRCEFEDVLKEIRLHPSQRFFVYKSIILRNLFGVDVMPEAVEICKLRLFLKLVSQIESHTQLEPLPDIDFNIRPGNALVGYASQREFELSDSLAADKGKRAQINRRLENLAEKFAAFRTAQISSESSPVDSKTNLRAELSLLSTQLDQYLAAEEYVVDPEKKKKFASWREAHRPFHWFAEFYDVMSAGGFDVVLGNPPWKEYSAVRETYTVKGYRSEQCGNLYALCTERSLKICKPHGRFSFIVQLPIVCSSRMETIRSLLHASSEALWVATFDDRPGKLFEGLQHCRAAIIMASRGAHHRATLTTRYHRWLTADRPVLFELMRYSGALDLGVPGQIIGKHSSPVSASLFRKLKQNTYTIGAFKVRRKTPHFVFYQEATQYWVKATSMLPFYAKNGKRAAPAHGRYMYFNDALTARATAAILNSSLFYLYFITYSDCFHLSDTLAASFPIRPEIAQDRRLAELNQELMTELERNAQRKKINSRRGGTVDVIEYDEYFGALCKPTINKIDLRLASLYSLTETEKEFVLSYDLKFRLGESVRELDDVTA